MDPLIAQSLVCYALQHNVRELEVDLTSYLIHPSKWVWPKSFYNSQLLTQLTLTNRHSSTYPNDIMPLPKFLGLPALNSLSLTGFIMNEDNFDPSIFSSCPNLETLNLAFTRTFHGHGLHDLKALRIHALNLKKLFFGALYDKKLLQDRCKLEIHAPKLTTFKCSGPFRIVCSTERLTCLDDVSFIMSFFSRIQERDLPYVMDTFKVFDQAKSLTLSVHIIEDLSKFPALLDGYGPLFTNIKCLKLKSNGDMRRELNSFNGYCGAAICRKTLFLPLSRIDLRADLIAAF
ncbi:hypothetical protein COLO4_10029 [Corchorus olitorius]|uniref:F-box/LRR-repeat protein 15/At3g58940/PEG3-like LRR domain-containing protein n=1 Tax=Corchorus olitorius TaxID=93759 RepID=A0A1R3KA71_9ROSI|nr:hypothetical protein COLO4_10029 [Corchorus olitorius]